MIFASRSPRDLNRDPWPRRRPGHYVRVAVDGELNQWLTRHDPRPEFDHPQHNEPNPILAAFRDVNAGRIVKAYPTTASLASAWAGMLFDPDCIQLRNADDAQRDHARRVLTRLARFA